MWSNPVSVVCALGDLKALGGALQGTNLKKKKNPFNIVYKFRAQHYEVAVAVGFSEVYCVSA